MAITQQIPRNTSTAAPGATVFPYDFKILLESDILVQVNGDVKALGVDYTVAGAGVDSGGSITFLAPMIGGETVIRRRAMKYDRLTDFQNLGDLRSATLNNDQDAPVMMIQQVADDVTRAVRLPVTVNGSGEIVGEFVPGMPLVIGPSGNSIEVGDGSVTGDMLLRGNLASPTIGSRIVFPAIETLGAVGDGVADDSDEFAAAAALGCVIKLKDGATYLLSRTIVMFPGSKFICDGRCTVVFKTGAGGFNSTHLDGHRSSGADMNVGFWFLDVDDAGLSGIYMRTDGAKEVDLAPVYVRDGGDVAGFDFSRLQFSGFYVKDLMFLREIGEGAYRIRDIEAWDCGTTNGPEYWTGSIPQVTVIAIDAGLDAEETCSFPGYISNVRGTNILMTGNALAAWGQQTDILGIHGVIAPGSLPSKNGPSVHGVYADGVGEVLDIFCQGASVTGVVARNTQHFVVKLTHGAQGNHVDVSHSDRSGIAVVTIAGSDETDAHCEFNHVVVHNCANVGASRVGSSEGYVVFFNHNHGTAAESLPINNTVEVHNVVSSASSSGSIVRQDQGTTSFADWNNKVRVGNVSPNWGARFEFTNSESAAYPVRTHFERRSPAISKTTSTQAITLGTPLDVDFTSAFFDPDGLVSGKYIKPKLPGWYRVSGQVRFSGMNSGNSATARIYRNSASPTVMLQQVTQFSIGTGDFTAQVSGLVYIDPSWIGLTDSELWVQVNVTGTGTVASIAGGTLGAFEVLPVGV